VKQIFLCMAIASLSLHATRTPHRGIKNQLPRLVVTSSDDPNHTYTLTDNNLRPTPLFSIFDYEHFMEHLLPTDAITSINGNGAHIKTAELNEQISTLLQEINQQKKLYSYFIILKNSGFVRHKKSGLLIVKFKHYPIVLKLFIEPAKSFVNPYDKGFEAANIFVMGGAIRHTLGFTRIKTLDYVRTKAKNDSYWRTNLTTPRKWFWLPQNPIWLEITTYNIGKKPVDHIRLPAIYGVIADALEQDLTHTPDHSTIMFFSKFLEHRIDPNTHNFFIDKSKGKLALIDTELFPLIAGFNKQIRPHHTHVKWYTYVAGHYLQKKIFTYKKQRQMQLHDLNNYYL